CVCACADPHHQPSGRREETPEAIGGKSYESLLQVFLAAPGGANDTPRGTAHMKKTLLAFLIIGLLVSAGYARGGHGGRRHAGGTISIRGYSTQGNVHPSTDNPGTKDPYGSMGGYSGGYGPWHSGHVEVNTSAVSSEMEAQEAG